MKTQTARETATELYARCCKIPRYNDFSFPSWLLCLSDPEKWGSEVLADDKRAQAALDDATYFFQVFSDGEHACECEAIQNGVYDLVMAFPYAPAIEGKDPGMTHGAARKEQR